MSKNFVSKTVLFSGNSYSLGHSIKIQDQTNALRKSGHGPCMRFGEFPQGIYGCRAEVVYNQPQFLRILHNFYVAFLRIPNITFEIVIMFAQKLTTFIAHKSIFMFCISIFSHLCPSGRHIHQKMWKIQLTMMMLVNIVYEMEHCDL